MNGNDLRILREAAKNIEHHHVNMLAATEDAMTVAVELVGAIIRELGDTLGKLCGNIHLHGVLVGRGIFVKEHVRCFIPGSTRVPIDPRVSWIDEVGRIRLSLVRDGTCVALPDDDVRRVVFMDPARGASRIALAIVEAISEQGRARVRKTEKMEEQADRLRALALLIRGHSEAAPREGKDGDA